MVLLNFGCAKAFLKQSLFSDENNRRFDDK